MYHHTLITWAEMVSEMLVIFNQLTWLTALKDFINITQC
jgi:hypothetical protein